MLSCQCPLTRLLSHQSHPAPRLQYCGQPHRRRGRLRARSHPQGDTDHHPEVSHRPRVFAFVSAPIDTKANAFPPFSFAHFYPVSESEHVPFPNTFSLASAHTRTHLPIPTPSEAAPHRAPRGPRPRPAVGRVGRACSRAHLTPLPTSRSQLEVQQPQRRSQTGRQRRRRQRRQHHLLASGRGAPRHRLASTPDSPTTPTIASPASPTSDPARCSPVAFSIPLPALRAPTPCPADAAASGHGAVGRVCGACEQALQGALAARTFTPASGVLRCVGALDGAPCAHAVLVDLRAGAVGWRSARSARCASGCTWLDH